MLKYSTQNTHPANAPELTNGLSLPVGNLAIWADVAGTFDLYKNGTRASAFFPHPENTGPFDMFGTTGTNANLFNFTAGNWRLDFTPKVGTKVSVSFTVGTVTPPPTDIEEIKEPLYIENGTHLLVETVSGKKYRAPVTSV